MILLSLIFLKAVEHAINVNPFTLTANCDAAFANYHIAARYALGGSIHINHIVFSIPVCYHIFGEIGIPSFSRGIHYQPFDSVDIQICGVNLPV